MSGFFPEEYFDKNPKTGYTYADSGSYNTMDCDQPLPNMSRHRLHSKERYSSMDYSTFRTTSLSYVGVHQPSPEDTPLNGPVHNYLEGADVSPLRLRSGKIIPPFNGDPDGIIRGERQQEFHVNNHHTSTTMTSHTETSRHTHYNSNSHSSYKRSVINNVSLFWSRIVHVVRVLTFFRYLKKSASGSMTDGEHKQNTILLQDIQNASDSGLDEEESDSLYSNTPVISHRGQILSSTETIVKSSLTNQIESSKYQSMIGANMSHEHVWTRRLLWPFLPDKWMNKEAGSTSVWSSIRTHISNTRLFNILRRAFFPQPAVSASSSPAKYCGFPLILFCLFLLCMAILFGTLYWNELENNPHIQHATSQIKEHATNVNQWMRSNANSLCSYLLTQMDDMFIPRVVTFYQYIFIHPRQYINKQMDTLWHYFLFFHDDDPSIQVQHNEHIIPMKKSIESLHQTIASLQSRVAANEKKLEEHQSSLHALRQADESFSDEIQRLKDLQMTLDGRLGELQRRVSANLHLQKPRWLEMQNRLSELMQKWSGVDERILGLHNQLTLLGEKETSQQDREVISRENERGRQEELQSLKESVDLWKRKLEEATQDMKEEKKVLELKLTGLERILTHFKDDSSSRASEMEALHSEIVSLHHRLETVEASKEKLEAALNEFSNVKETLSKLESLVKECGDCKTSIVKVEGDNQDINLDNRIHSLIQNAIIYYAQDPVNKPDYALESSGGSILGTRCTKTYSGRPGVFSFFGIPVMKFYRSPRTVIQPSVHPGECWAFEKDHGQVVIQLSMEIFVSAVTLEHIPRSLSPFNRIDSAPKDFIIKVLESEKDHEGHLLGNFTYVDSGPSIQTFNTIPMDRSFRFILFEVLSNHGNPEYTCVYRLRVHGTPINP